MLCKPFRNCSRYNITQNFTSKQHEATDFVSTYGTILLAPENVKIEKILDGDMTPPLPPDDWGSMDKGYGVLMSAIDNPNRRYSYWHCWPNFPVNIGDTILKGKPVAFMGNSGMCISGGVIVPTEVKNKPPYLGTHLHLSAGENNICFNIADRIDWDYEPTLTFQERLLVIQIVIQRIISYLKRS